MKRFNSIHLVRNGVLVFVTILLFNSCDRSSSPEGRMSMKLEELHKEMADSLQQQNRAILDSLGKIREELRALQQQRK